MPRSDIAISVQGLSKAYTIGRLADRPVTLAESVLARVRRPFARPGKETFWALRDLSFDIAEGEVVGVIGRNGAGKSTLLKVLSRITEPTAGRVELFGRVGSLLEVGTGFHPELTGRENVFLNGAILGMSKSEIRRQFDAIVDFAGVEKFLDTPVKRYSSGMYVRLAFAVAAHLRSEILIVDEVLAVGDIEFQARCMGKMKDVASDGRTVILVSHNMAAIEHLSTKVLFLNAGQFVRFDQPQAAIEAYQSFLRRQTAADALAARDDRSGTGEIRLTGFSVQTPDGRAVDSVRSGQDVDLVLQYRSPSGQTVRGPVDVGFSIGFGDKDLLTVFYGSYANQVFRDVPPAGEFRFHLPRLPFAEGRYFVGARVLVDKVESDWPRDGVGELVVEAGNFFGTGQKGHEAAPVLIATDITLRTDSESLKPAEVA